MEAEYEKLLDRLYYKEHNYDGANALYKKAKLQLNTITKSYVSNWLKEQSTAQQNKTDVLSKKKLLKPIYTEDHYSFQIDLTFLNKYESKNDKRSVMFTAININSRYAYAYSSINKDADTIISMLETFKDNALEIHSITSDSGSEFTNKKVVKWFEDNEIKTFFVVSDSHKLGIINRFHRTLKGKLLNYFTATNSVRWIDVLPKIIKNYNNTFNRGIGFTPLQASKPFITTTIIQKAIEKTELIESKEQVYHVGDYCRVLKKTNLFDTMQTNYSENVYQITKVNKNTVDIDNATHEYFNVKKKWIQLITNVRNHKPSTEKEPTENYSRMKNKLKRLGIDYL